jgi:hypothetical protein
LPSCVVEAVLSFPPRLHELLVRIVGGEAAPAPSAVEAAAAADAAEAGLRSIPRFHEGLVRALGGNAAFIVGHVLKGRLRRRRESLNKLFT